MDALEGSLCYLIGAIDHASDQGVGWRKDLIDKCKNLGLKIKFLDPTNKVTGLQEEIGEEHNKNVRLKATGQWDELSSVMRTIVRQDHRCVDLSDFVIFYLDISVHTCGSYFELQSAFSQKKPYFIIVPTGKYNTPAWLFGICDHNYIFESIDAVVEHLLKLNSGVIQLSDRWVLFRKQIRDL